MTAQDRHNLEYLRIDELELWEEANVRKHEPMENIDELANNVKKNGLQVPLLVRKKTGGKYGVFSGQRRLMACAKAGMSTVPCFVFEKISLTQARVLSLSENLYRLSMDYEDKSNAANRLLKHFKRIEKVASALGVNISTVKKYLGYNALPDELKQLVAQKKISSTQAVNIYAKFPDDRSLTFAREMANIPVSEKKKRTSMRFALESSKKTAKLEDVNKIAKTMEDGIMYRILLPKKKSKTVEKIASVRLSTKEEIATEMVLNAIDRYERGEDR